MSRPEIVLFFVVLWALLACPLSAQVSPAGSAESTTPANQLEEVVVTARKRTEAPIDVPISMTTFPQETLSRLNIRSFNDYATKTPNFSFSYGTAGIAFGATRSILPVPM